MSETQATPVRPEIPASAPARPGYVTPSVTTYTDAALLAALGPAQAQAGYFRLPN